MPKFLHPKAARPQQFHRVAAATFAFLVFAGGIGRAEDASAWDSDQRSALRLIAGSSGNGMPMLRAGVAMRIDPGWKTYWRYAGDSGLPPLFDFAGSENVKSVTVLWPAPRRFPDGAGGHSIGYSGDIFFPLQVVAEDARAPVTLRLKASYGVCEKVCIPAAGKAQLELAGGASSEDAALTYAELKVPKRVALNAPGSLALRAARRETSSGRQRVVVDVVAPDGVEADLFAEGPAPQWSLPLPELVESGAGGARRFAFDVDGVPPGASIAGAQLKFTLVAGDEAIEVLTHLD
jgi:DsbC/DsbD-like thiol-disulfide interchange protein